MADTLAKLTVSMSYLEFYKYFGCNVQEQTDFKSILRCRKVAKSKWKYLVNLRMNTFRLNRTGICIYYVLIWIKVKVFSDVESYHCIRNITILESENTSGSSRPCFKCLINDLRLVGSNIQQNVRARTFLWRCEWNNVQLSPLKHFHSSKEMEDFLLSLPKRN